MRSWLQWPTIIASIPGWIAFIAFLFTLRRNWYERIILKFALNATHTDAEDGDNATGEMDGTLFIRAIGVTITNNGLRPVTIQRIGCNYSFTNKQGASHRTGGRAFVNKKIGQGESCFAVVKMQSKPDEILTVYASDSTEKEWSVPKKKLKALNKDARLQWH